MLPRLFLCMCVLIMDACACRQRDLFHLNPRCRGRPFSVFFFVFSCLLLSLFFPPVYSLCLFHISVFLHFFSANISELFFFFSHLRYVHHVTWLTAGSRKDWSMCDNKSNNESIKSINESTELMLLPRGVAVAHLYKRLPCGYVNPLRTHWRLFLAHPGQRILSWKMYCVQYEIYCLSQ